MRLSWWLSGKESACKAGDAGLILGQEDPLEKEMATHSSILPGESHGQRGGWWATAHGVTKSQTRQSNGAHTSCSNISTTLDLGLLFLFSR